MFSAGSTLFGFFHCLGTSYYSFIFWRRPDGRSTPPKLGQESMHWTSFGFLVTLVLEIRRFRTATNNLIFFMNGALKFFLVKITYLPFWFLTESTQFSRTLLQSCHAWQEGSMFCDCLIDAWISFHQKRVSKVENFIFALEAWNESSLSRTRLRFSLLISIDNHTALKTLIQSCSGL